MRLNGMYLMAAVLPSVAAAEAPRVVTDIPPVAALVAQIMEGVRAPDVMIPAGASPHHANLRPSDAMALEAADVVIWIGPDLTPQLQRPVSNLAGEAQLITLMELEGVHLLDPRSDADHEEHEDGEHDHDDHGDEEHEHDEHDHDEHEEHGDEGEHEHAHDHGEYDPHLWLDPANAALWLDVIASELADQDPENAELYRANAAAAQAEIEAAAEDVRAQLAPLSDRPFVVVHDALQYFEQEMGISAAAVLTEVDDASPTVSAMSALYDLAEGAPLCVLAEPGGSTALFDLLNDDPAFNVTIVRPLGPDGADWTYAQMLRAMGDDFAACLG